MEGVWSTRMGGALAAAGLDVHDLPPLERLSAGQKQKVMRTFTESLGIPCLGCHSEESFAADTRRKRIAKRMYNEIVRALALRDGEPVYCDSCHDGDLFMLDRRDTARLTRHMSQVMVGQLTRVDGRPHDRTSCHGDPPDLKMLTTWKGSAAPEMVLEGQPASGGMLAPHLPAMGARDPVDCGPSSEKCPLQKIMRDDVSNAVASADGPRLAVVLDRVAAAAPEASWTWGAIARQGAVAARARATRRARARPARSATSSTRRRGARAIAPGPCHEAPRSARGGRRVCAARRAAPRSGGARRGVRVRERLRSLALREPGTDGLGRSRDRSAAGIAEEDDARSAR